MAGPYLLTDDNTPVFIPWRSSFFLGGCVPLERHPESVSVLAMIEMTAEREVEPREEGRPKMGPEIAPRLNRRMDRVSADLRHPAQLDLGGQPAVHI